MNIIKQARNLQRESTLREKYNYHIQQMAASVAEAAPDPDDSKTVISFNASTRISGLSLNAAFAMLIGWSLRLQGARVVNFICKRGLSRCVLGTNQDNILQSPPCEKCLAQSAVIYDRSEVQEFEYSPNAELMQKIQHADLLTLRDFRFEGIPLGELCLPAMRWILRRHHLEDNRPTRHLYRHYVSSAYQVARQFKQLIEKVRLHSVLVFNGMLYPEAAARWVAQAYNLPVYTYEVGLSPFSVFITKGDATAYPVDISDDFQLNSEQNQQLDDYLSKRFKGDFSMAGVQFWPEMKGLDQKLVAKINSFKQVVPIFTNVIFDTSQPHANVIFPHMFAWLDDVLAVIKKHPETLFVIRAHPDESRPGKTSRESVAKWVRDRHADELPNVVFISPEEYFSSYEMIQRAKFVMIFNSTIGLEASILGAPVLCAGKARFTQLNAVHFPTSREAYLTKLDQMLAAENVQAPVEHKHNARRFLYYQLFRTSLPFTRFLEPDGIWPGFVCLQDFSWQDLLPEKSTTLKVISEGLLQGKDFLLPEE